MVRPDPDPTFFSKSRSRSESFFFRNAGRIRPNHLQTMNQCFGSGLWYIYQHAKFLSWFETYLWFFCLIFWQFKYRLTHVLFLYFNKYAKAFVNMHYMKKKILHLLLKFIIFSYWFFQLYNVLSICLIFTPYIDFRCLKIP